MLQNLLWQYAAAILHNLRQDGSQVTESNAFHDPLGQCLHEFWGDPVEANRHVLDIVNSKLPIRST